MEAQAAPERNDSCCLMFLYSLCSDRINYGCYIVDNLNNGYISCGCNPFNWLICC